MEYVLYAIFFLSCLVLILVVLLQPGKTDAGALFTSNVSSNAFGPRGTATVLSKATIVTATIFMLSALMLSMPGLTGTSSVLTTNPETPAEAPATAPNANTDSNMSNANSPVTVPPITDLSNSGNTTAPANTNTTNTNPAGNGNVRTNVTNANR